MRVSEESDDDPIKIKDEMSIDSPMSKKLKRSPKSPKRRSGSKKSKKNKMSPLSIKSISKSKSPDEDSKESRKKAKLPVALHSLKYNAQLIWYPEGFYRGETIRVPIEHSDQKKNMRHGLGILLYP